jgi:hypothetical protein
MTGYNVTACDVAVHAGPMNDSRVARGDFRCLTPLAVAEVIPPPPRIWTSEDWAIICRGHKSADMDDRWNAIVEDQRLYLHRSWTGRGVYEAEFRQVADGWQVASALVEGDRDSYRRQDDAFETALLEALIEGVLLRDFHGAAHQRLAKIRAQRES